ncbi:hypothetical protein BDU57DRAFT_156109 [Ampelomyces quisqualis]|uniref:Uncharacterized protein n=1 Tax=Ampelomyces quisqualis TaxID=50730 RepID=A0A6A5QW47_AMPQU|nr:hypothetical protein BDU57DRAFT_156109 [Ampelomyces quisqualis]
MSGTRSGKGKGRLEDDLLPSIKDFPTLTADQLPELRDFSAPMIHASGRRETPTDPLLLSTKLYGYKVQPDLQLPPLHPDVPTQGPPGQAAYEQLAQQPPSNPAAYAAMQAPPSESGQSSLPPQPPVPGQAAQQPQSYHFIYEGNLHQPQTVHDMQSGMQLSQEPPSSSPDTIRFAHYHSTTGQLAGPGQSQSQQAAPATNYRFKANTPRKAGNWTCCLCTASKNAAPEIVSAKWRCPVVHRDSDKVNERGYHLRCDDCKSGPKGLRSLLPNAIQHAHEHAATGQASHDQSQAQQAPPTIGFQFVSDAILYLMQ